MFSTKSQDIRNGDLMDYQDLSKEELIDMVKSLENRKKYGLVWESEKSAEHFTFDNNLILPLLEEKKDHRLHSERNSQNNYLIQGDNYFVLRTLLYTHRSSIDVIYIDPPYNTGNKDFKYNDSFVLKEDSYRHSKWLNFMSKRLKIAKQLLKDDGIIFISIDDNEIAQLRILCDDIFGEKNFISCFVWEKKRKASNLDSRVRGITEYVLAYGKLNARPIIHPFDVVEEEKPYPFYNTGNPRSIIEFPAGLTFSSLEDGKYLPNEYRAKKTLVTLIDSLEILNGKSTNAFRLEGEWRYSQKWLNNAMSNGEEIVFKGVDFKPYWINRDPERSKKMKTLLNYENYQIETNEVGNEELFALIGENDFSFPKPTSLIAGLIAATTAPQSDAIILDFFAGSGTTGDAVLKLNSQDGGNRNFILVTNNEGNICTDITYPRLNSVINGNSGKDGSNFGGKGGSLYFLESIFVAKSLNSDEMKLRILDNCVDLLCFKENLHNEIENVSESFRVFTNDDKVLGVYTALDHSDLNVFRDFMLSSTAKRKKVYIFTFDQFGLNPNELLHWGDIEMEPIPQKILELVGDSIA